MAVRKVFAWSLLGVCLASMAILSLTGSPVVAGPFTELAFPGKLRQAERILIGTPEKDVDVAGGEQFLVVIDRVLRGNGQKGKLARIIQDGDKSKRQKFEAKKQYVFLLKDNKGGEGWISVPPGTLPFRNGKIQISSDLAEDLSLDELQDLIASNPVAKPEAPARASLEGRWIVTLSQQGSDLYFWLVEVTKDKEQFQAKLLATTKGLSATTLKSFSIGEQEANFVFESDGQAFEFTGRLERGSVWGNIAVDKRGVLPARLVATSAAGLKGEEAKPSPGRSEFVEAIGAEESFATLEKFAGKFADSPLVLDAYRELINQSKKQSLKQPKVEELAGQYLKAAQRWGALLELKAQIDVGVILARNDFLPEVAMKYLSAAEAKFTPETLSAWKLPVLTEKARLLIANGKEAEGLAILEPLHAENPFDPELTYTLARQAEKSKRIDQAIELYAEISVLPMMQQMLEQQWSRGGEKNAADNPLPSHAVRRLWKEKHGNTNELKAYLNEIYEQKLLGFPHSKVEARPEGTGTRVVLCELFTGAKCPPCVGADVATAALEATYPASDVIVLRYHQHIPGPDPLANDDAQQRFSYYQGEGTPTLALAGKKVDGAGGFLMHAESLYKRLREEIDPTLREKIALTIELSAEMKEGVLALSAKAGGLEKFPDDVHLRLVLAEDKVEFVAGNGIRLHEMVVRSMPGGSEGIAPKEGQLKFSDELDLAKLKSGLVKYLGKVETEMATQFEEKPLAFKGLHLVAFLQNDSTQEVLQAASIPVSGTLPAAEEPAQKAAKEKASEEDVQKPQDKTEKKPADSPPKPKSK